MSSLHCKQRVRGSMLVGLAVVVLTGCVQIDFVRDYPLAGYPAYSGGGSGGGSYYPFSYYSEEVYPGGSNGYYPGAYYSGGYLARGYYPYSRGLDRGLFYAGDPYPPYPSYLFNHDHLRYGCSHPIHGGGAAAPLTPPVIRPDDPGAGPKAPRGRNGGPVKEWRDVERPAAGLYRSPVAVRSPAVSSRPAALSNPTPPTRTETARSPTVTNPAVRPAVALPARAAPVVVPRSVDGMPGGPRLLQIKR